MLNRRNLLMGLGTILITAPAIVPYSSLMPLPHEIGKWAELLNEGMPTGIMRRIYNPFVVFEDICPWTDNGWKVQRFDGVRIVRAGRELQRSRFNDSKIITAMYGDLLNLSLSGV